MKKIVGYLRHFTRSRGRHGTHSPFVYAFVEQVMRRSDPVPPVPDAVRIGAGCSPKAIRLLYYTLQYLQPEGIVAGRGMEPLLQHLAGNRLLRQAEVPAGDGLVLWIVSHKEDQLPAQASSWLARNRSALLYLKPQGNAAKVWAQLATLAPVKFALNYWYWGLLLHDEAFKARQYFRIR